MTSETLIPETLAPETLAEDVISPIANNVIPFVPHGKIRCYVTGTLRQDKPEEHVRQRWARSLVEEYK